MQGGDFRAQLDEMLVILLSTNKFVCTDKVVQGLCPTLHAVV